MTQDFKSILRVLNMFETPALIDADELQMIPKGMICEPVYLGGFLYMLGNEEEALWLEENTRQHIQSDFIALVVVPDAKAKRVSQEWKEFIRDL